MALPNNYDTVTVKGAYINLDGSAASGTVAFAANVSGFLTDAGADVMILPVGLTVSLDGQGTFSTALPATDDPDISPSGFTYTVTEKLSTGQRTYSITVPSAGGTVDLVTVAPVQSVTASVQLIPAPPSPADGQVLTWDGTARKWIAANPAGAVSSVNGDTGVVVLTAADVGADASGAAAAAQAAAEANASATYVPIASPPLGSADNPVTSAAAARPSRTIVYWLTATQPTNYVAATDIWMETA